MIETQDLNDEKTGDKINFLETEITSDGHYQKHEIQEIREKIDAIQDIKKMESELHGEVLQWINTEVKLANEIAIKESVPEQLLKVLDIQIKYKDPVIHKKLKQKLSKCKDPGIRGIYYLQASLKILGYKGTNQSNISLDGIFGKQSFYALINYQKNSKTYGSEQIEGKSGKADGITGIRTINSFIKDLGAIPLTKTNNIENEQNAIDELKKAINKIAAINSINFDNYQEIEKNVEQAELQNEKTRTQIGKIGINIDKIIKARRRIESIKAIISLPDPQDINISNFQDISKDLLNTEEIINQGNRMNGLKDLEISKFDKISEKIRKIKNPDTKQFITQLKEEIKGDYSIGTQAIIEGKQISKTINQGNKTYQVYFINKGLDLKNPSHMMIIDSQNPDGVLIQKIKIKEKLLYCQNININGQEMERIGLNNCQNNFLKIFSQKIKQRLDIDY